MSSLKKIYICSKCDAQFPKWSGRCLGCGAWSTLSEQVISSNQTKTPNKLSLNKNNLINFSDIKNQTIPRLKTQITELDSVLGGGIVSGSLILLGGEPGIGKSTLALQIIKNLAGQKLNILYISGEESPDQIKLRADRLNWQDENLNLLQETKLEQIIAAIEELDCDLIVIDSIQTIYSEEIAGEPGNITQIRACSVKLLETAKKTKTSVIITGHVTKDGAVAGPKTLEHLVDVVIYLEGDRFHDLRILRSVKNRFGSTNEIGLFEMTATGLKEVTNPSSAFFDQSTANQAGTALSCFIEGSRPFLTEVQALATTTIFGYPQRKVSGYDLNRLQMLTAVIGKRTNLNLTNKDIHLNIVGGYKTKETALDLAVVSAIISSTKNIALNSKTIYIGEVGLGGEVRPVSQMEKRLREAEKLSFTSAVIPKLKTKPA
ncbi:DNA repair protein RadA, partial [Candidatus Falkowbacteria bacterium RIFOXYA2_FULL_35_8]